ncbi:class I SAM-dependent methyltransferase [candidate division CSSED10-310 bacterium]|uniref:Class I SAM-dependent methyltransferase n=1 Tax=candidate division CSSED10-310 bacterium TaxID=2855610 RepID=A0ABV6YZU7_UNCC1
MNNNLDHDEIGFLLILDRMLMSKKLLLTQHIKQIMELKIPALLDNYNALLLSLADKGLLRDKGDILELTETGTSILSSITKEHCLHVFFYNAYYQAVLNSEAHALFCEKVYGRNLAQHGMVDLEQLDILFNEINIEKSHSVLDFGCGDGRITEYISDNTNTLGTGIDIAPRAIQLALERTAHKRDRLRFFCVDVEKNIGSFPEEIFDDIIALDSIFFVQNLPPVVKKLVQHLKPGGSIALFYWYPRVGKEPFQADQTRLGKALSDLDLKYSTRDLSDLNTKHWLNKKKILLELQNMFYQEGNEFLFKNRIAECDGGLENIHRHLFLIKKD